ncbi:hypothetical protein D9C73_027308 [Collichthys lucidus]|uniref:Uncharacterized protein n=1 Tax=Collichthys lucidus TaxID=240159 RepID=A0A4U5VVA4_COLLU|nr:hypothetical protein D9C73_027308 [Collichthys lucidus]
MEASGEAADNGGQALAEDVTPALHKYLTVITTEIRELKNDITALNTSFKQEFASFKEDVYTKLKANKDELQDQKKSLSEAQTRIEELETFNLEAKDALLTTLREQRKLQDKLTDLEGRGMDVQIKEADGEHRMEERIHAAWSWQRVGEPGASAGLTQRTRGRLQEFRRAEDRGNI